MLNVYEVVYVDKIVGHHRSAYVECSGATELNLCRIANLGIAKICDEFSFSSGDLSFHSIRYVLTKEEV